MSKLLIALGIVYVCFIIATFAQTSRPTATTPATPTTPAPPQVRFIREYVPLSCAVPIRANYLATFHYAAHLLTKDNRVGEIFDETADYNPAILQVNARSMLPPLAQGMIGACIDERRTVIIPHQFFSLEGVPKGTDVAFMVHVIDIKPNNDMFEIIDTDSSGCIELPEMIRYVKSTGRVVEKDIEITAKRLMRHNDRNKDGVIECEELVSPNEKNCDIVTSCKALRDSFDTFFDDFNSENHITADDLNW